MITNNPITQYNEEMSDMMFPGINQLYLLIANSALWEHILTLDISLH